MTPANRKAYGIAVVIAIVGVLVSVGVFAAEKGTKKLSFEAVVTNSYEFARFEDKEYGIVCYADHREGKQGFSCVKK